ncbi:sulfotransferase domain-containing protein [Desulfovibrio sp. JC010]|uniref:sulfotransferase domain-containing protein n=1 Tax=Desulfovibrio sp. JC010 TaxID=2593641 RepID=UPI0013D33444|nr:sulfotransferase domain-containing protein [Desulfovibrio sp. JC010]NDV26005.1 hypothetical protein [Desulfovibrio sp. JC010]
MECERTFLVVSSVRSGSTWLETMLGSLADVTVDFEFKWIPEYYAYTPEPVHKHIPNSSFSCQTALTEIAGETLIKGSKLTLEACPHLDHEFADLKQTVDSEIRIIHLRRRYRDVYLSLIRGCMHLVDRNSVGFDDSSNSVILNAILEIEKQVIETMDKPPFVADTKFCRMVMESLVANDRWAESLRENRRHFFTIDYNNVHADFHKMASFIGSKASQKELDTVLKCPLTKKLPKWPFRERIKNYNEVEKIIEEYEGSIHF